MTTYAVVDPRTSEMVASYPLATAAEIRTALAGAAAAHVPWSSTSLRRRADLLRRVAQLHLSRADALAQTITREMGKPREDAFGEAEFASSIYQYYADNSEQLLEEERIELLHGEGSAVVRRCSIGPLLGIMPWNYPLYQVARFVAPNLLLGNTVIVKHASQCPESAAAIQGIFDDAEVPPGVYGNVYASREQVTEIIEDSRVQGVSLTGSEQAGAHIAEIAGRHLKKVVLELGGSDPFIVLSTKRLEETVDAAVAARLENTGQACNGGKRFIIVDDLYDSFVDLFVSRLAVAWTGAPLSSPKAAAALAEQVDRAVSQGATYISGGEREGCYFPPGVLTNVSRDNGVHREELFGPVAIVYRVADELQAVEVANDTPYGLGSYVFTTDPVQADRISDALHAGMVFVNGVGLEGAELPFGGIKRSGFGRELGRLGVEEFSNRKLIRTLG